MSKSLLIGIAKKYKQPVYIYDSQRVIEKINRLRSVFSKNLQIHYAMKANNFKPLLKTICKSSTGVDVVSGGEIEHALSCGFKPSKIIFSGVAKSEDEILLALRSNVFCINVESPQELERIGKLSKNLNKIAKISFRLNPDVNPKTHPYITTGFKENKFGMDKSFLPALLNILNKYKNLKLIGLDFHIGSQLTQLAPFSDALKKSTPIYKNLLASGYPLMHFNIGGGIGISYQNQKTIDLKRYAQTVEKYLLPLGCEIHCEPGRYLVADAGYLVARVEYIKKTPYKNFIIVNTGMHHLIRPSLYGAYHKIEVVTKNRHKIKADVVGPICESSDFLAKNRVLKEPSQGDFIIVYDAGAYGATMSSHYNMQTQAIEVLI